MWKLAEVEVEEEELGGREHRESDEADEDDDKYEDRVGRWDVDAFDDDSPDILGVNVPTCKGCLAPTGRLPLLGPTLVIRSRVLSRDATAAARRGRPVAGIEICRVYKIWVGIGSTIFPRNDRADFPVGPHFDPAESCLCSTRVCRAHLLLNILPESQSLDVSDGHDKLKLTADELPATASQGGILDYQ